MGSGEKELYPIGTNILAKYIGTLQDGKIAYELSRTAFNQITGELYTHAGQSASEIFIPINPKYRYRKTDPNGRSNFHYLFYDASYAFIEGYDTGGTWADSDLRTPPPNAKYMRVSTQTQIRTAAIIRIEQKGDTT